MLIRLLAVTLVLVVGIVAEASHDGDSVMLYDFSQTPVAWDELNDPGDILLWWRWHERAAVCSPCMCSDGW